MCQHGYQHINDSRHFDTKHDAWQISQTPLSNKRNLCLLQLSYLQLQSSEVIHPWPFSHTKERPSGYLLSPLPRSKAQTVVHKPTSLFFIFKYGLALSIFPCSIIFHNTHTLCSNQCSYPNMRCLPCFSSWLMDYTLLCSDQALFFSIPNSRFQIPDSSF
jgi:hypothetical protein